MPWLHTLSGMAPPWHPHPGPVLRHCVGAARFALPTSRGREQKVQEFLSQYLDADDPYGPQGTPQRHGGSDVPVKRDEWAMQ